MCVYILLSTLSHERPTEKAKPVKVCVYVYCCVYQCVCTCVLACRALAMCLHVCVYAHCAVKETYNPVRQFYSR